MWFIYMRVHNVNRKDKDEKDSSPPKKLQRKEKILKHVYPAIPAFSDDEESNKRNLKLLKDEISKPKSSKEIIKTLMTRTFPYRRKSLLESEVSVSECVKELPVLKKYEYVSYVCFNVWMYICVYQ